MNKSKRSRVSMPSSALHDRLQSRDRVTRFSSALSYTLLTAACCHCGCPVILSGSFEHCSFHCLSCLPHKHIFVIAKNPKMLPCKTTMMHKHIVADPKNQLGVGARLIHHQNMSQQNWFSSLIKETKRNTEQPNSEFSHRTVIIVSFLLFH